MTASTLGFATPSRSCIYVLVALSREKRENKSLAKITNHTVALNNYLKLHFTPFTGPAGSLDPEHRLTVNILDREPWVDEGTVLLDVSNGGAGG